MRSLVLWLAMFLWCCIGFAFGYHKGQHGADRWYHANWEPKKILFCQGDEGGIHVRYVDHTGSEACIAPQMRRFIPAFLESHGFSGYNCFDANDNPISCDGPCPEGQVCTARCAGEGCMP